MRLNYLNLWLNNLKFIWASESYAALSQFLPKLLSIELLIGVDLNPIYHTLTWYHD
jgi:hypothetical protein